MFKQSLSKHNEEIKYNNSSDLAKSLKKSKTINKQVNQNLNDFKTSGENSKHYSSSEPYSFYKNLSEIDLALSVGSFNYEMDITTNDSSYIVDVTMGDTYDFELWPWDKKFAFINNVGYALQCAGVVKPYNWDISYRIVVSKE